MQSYTRASRPSVGCRSVPTIDFTSSGLLDCMAVQPFDAVYSEHTTCHSKQQLVFFGPPLSCCCDLDVHDSSSEWWHSIFFLWPLSRRLVAREETSNRHQRWSDRLSNKRRASAFPSQWLTAEVEEPLLPAVANSPSKGGAQPSFRPSDIYSCTKRLTIEKKERPHSEGGTSCSKNRTTQAEQARHSKETRLV